MSAEIGQIFQEVDPEILAHLPKSFQMFYSIQKEAVDEVKKILENVRAGNTTIENEIMRLRRVN
ncbi:hypothetical protein FTO70_04625 [Methanosarcina sp. KYL-1]|uniref:hypothetical protein n=1 Tax=Methanosarcina sp. KYL-1 TaxID=2602068 RepID=UPI002100F931|nr:hypothetical protein [Methanosarcina sp. KYL-1]MCQ1534983.1 hypothetical protein [Methanosarcina sp. KYL-1]